MCRWQGGQRWALDCGDGDDGNDGGDGDYHEGNHDHGDDYVVG